MRSALGRKTIRLVAAATTLVLVIGVVPASATTPEEPLDRREVIARAKTWTRERVPYSQVGHLEGYRRDCSGFVSMAWDLPDNLTTWRIPLVAEPITKDEILAGDVLLDATSPGGGRHVVMFEKWANAEKTRFYVLESTGQDGVDGAIRRVVPYPYRVNKARYKPYRYVSMDRYWEKMPTSHLQPVKGYAGDVDTPEPVLLAMKREAEKKLGVALAADPPKPLAEKAARELLAEADARLERQRRAEEERLAAEAAKKAARLAAKKKAEEARLAAEKAEAERIAADPFLAAWVAADRRRAEKMRAERAQRAAEQTQVVGVAGEEATLTVDASSLTATESASATAYADSIPTTMTLGLSSGFELRPLGPRN